MCRTGGRDWVVSAVDDAVLSPKTKSAYYDWTFDGSNGRGVSSQVEAPQWSGRRMVRGRPRGSIVLAIARSAIQPPEKNPLREAAPVRGWLSQPWASIQ
jgi:hypothetical protein